MWVSFVLSVLSSLSVLPSVLGFQQEKLLRGRSDFLSDVQGNLAKKLATSIVDSNGDVSTDEKGETVVKVALDRKDDPVIDPNSTAKNDVITSEKTVGKKKPFTGADFDGPYTPGEYKSKYYTAPWKHKPTHFDEHAVAKQSTGSEPTATNTPDTGDEPVPSVEQTASPSTADEPTLNVNPGLSREQRQDIEEENEANMRQSREARATERRILDGSIGGNINTSTETFSTNTNTDGSQIQDGSEIQDSANRSRIKDSNDEAEDLSAERISARQRLDVAEKVNDIEKTIDFSKQEKLLSRWINKIRSNITHAENEKRTDDALIKAHEIAAEREIQKKEEEKGKVVAKLSNQALLEKIKKDQSDMMDEMAKRNRQSLIEDDTETPNSFLSGPTDQSQTHTPSLVEKGKTTKESTDPLSIEIKENQSEYAPIAAGASDIQKLMEKLAATARASQKEFDTDRLEQKRQHDAEGDKLLSQVKAMSDEIFGKKGEEGLFSDDTLEVKRIGDKISGNNRNKLGNLNSLLQIDDKSTLDISDKSTMHGESTVDIHDKSSMDEESSIVNEVDTGTEASAIPANAPASSRHSASGGAGVTTVDAQPAAQPAASSSGGAGAAGRGWVTIDAQAAASSGGTGATAVDARPTSPSGVQAASSSGGAGPSGTGATTDNSQAGSQPAARKTQPAPASAQESVAGQPVSPAAVSGQLSPGGANAVGLSTVTAALGETNPNAKAGGNTGKDPKPASTQGGKPSGVWGEPEAPQDDEQPMPSYISPNPIVSAQRKRESRLRDGLDSGEQMETIAQWKAEAQRKAAAKKAADLKNHLPKAMEALDAAAANERIKDGVVEHEKLVEKEKEIEKLEKKLKDCTDHAAKNAEKDAEVEEERSNKVEEAANGAVKENAAEEPSSSEKISAGKSGTTTEKSHKTKTEESAGSGESKTSPKTVATDKSEAGTEKSGETAETKTSTKKMVKKEAFVFSMDAKKAEEAKLLKLKEQKKLEGQRQLQELQEQKEEKKRKAYQVFNDNFWNPLSAQAALETTHNDHGETDHGDADKVDKSAKGSGDSASLLREKHRKEETGKEEKTNSEDHSDSESHLDKKQQLTLGSKLLASSTQQIAKIALNGSKEQRQALQATELDKSRKGTGKRMHHIHEELHEKLQEESDALREKLHEHEPFVDHDFHIHHDDDSISAVNHAGSIASGNSNSTDSAFGRVTKGLSNGSSMLEHHATLSPAEDATLSESEELLNTAEEQPLSAAEEERKELHDVRRNFARMMESDEETKRKLEGRDENSNALLEDRQWQEQLKDMEKKGKVARENAQAIMDQLAALSQEDRHKKEMIETLDEEEQAENNALKDPLFDSFWEEQKAEDGDSTGGEDDVKDDAIVFGDEETKPLEDSNIEASAPHHYSKSIEASEPISLIEEKEKQKENQKQKNGSKTGSKGKKFVITDLGATDPELDAKFETTGLDASNFGVEDPLSNFDSFPTDGAATDALANINGLATSSGLPTNSAESMPSSLSELISPPNNGKKDFSHDFSPPRRNNDFADDMGFFSDKKSVDDDAPQPSHTLAGADITQGALSSSSKLASDLGLIDLGDITIGNKRKVEEQNRIIENIEDKSLVDSLRSGENPYFQVEKPSNALLDSVDAMGSPPTADIAAAAAKNDDMTLITDDNTGLLDGNNSVSSGLSLTEIGKSGDLSRLSDAEILDTNPDKGIDFGTMSSLNEPIELDAVPSVPTSLDASLPAQIQASLDTDRANEKLRNFEENRENQQNQVYNKSGSALSTNQGKLNGSSLTETNSKTDSGLDSISRQLTKELTAVNSPLAKETEILKGDSTIVGGGLDGTSFLDHERKLDAVVSNLSAKSLQKDLQREADINSSFVRADLRPQMISVLAG